MKMRTIVGSLSFVCVLALGADRAAAQADAPKDASKTQAAGADRRFADEAANAGMAEVELGRLGVQKATKPEVKSFAQMMVEDHGKANQELKTLASSKGIDLPSEPRPDAKAEKERLEKLSGASFDDAFMKTMAKDHQKAVDLFSKQASSGSDPDLRQWAQQKLPTIKQHLAKAKELAEGKPAASSGQ